jgi:hypothetical protein
MKFFCFPVLRWIFVFILAVVPFIPARAVSISSSTHPTLVTRDFSREVGFAPYQRTGGVESGARFEIENGALKITNEYAGSFGVDTKVPAFDAEKYGRLFFDYRIPPAQNPSQSVKVNVFARVKGRYHGVRFTGPSEVRPGSVYLGELHDVAADGKWHRAYLPLRDWLRELYPREAQLQVEEIVIGNWDNSNYLMAGIGGNGAGATWEMDNFALTGTGPAEAKFEMKSDDGKPLAPPGEYSWSLDGGEAKPLPGAALTVATEAGFHLLRVFDKAGKEVGAYGFFTAIGAPVIGVPALQNDVLKIPIQTAAGLNLKNLKLAVGARSFETDSPYLRWDGAAGVLRLEAAEAGLSWQNGEEISLALIGVQDRLGRSSPDWKGVLKMQYATQKSTPVPPQLAALKSAGAGTFEESLDEWSTREGEGGAIVERDSSTSASGKFSVRLTSPTNSASMGAWVRRTPFDAVKFPVIEFDYKIPFDVRADFHMSVGGQIYSVGFTDRTPQYPRIGQIADVKADDKWHHARIDLLAWLRAARPTADRHNIEWIVLSDSGYLGNARGAQLWIDNFQLAPVVKGTPFQSVVSLPDVTGVQAVSWVLDNNAATVPPAAPTQSGAEIKVPGAGSRWLHLRVQNGAGVWSETAHVPLTLDTGAPVVGEILPAPGAKSGAPALTVKVADDTGLDAEVLRLNFQGQEYSLSSDAFSYNDAAGLLTLDLQKLERTGKLAPLADGTALTWKLSNVRDAVGQGAPDVGGNWTYDLASDKTLPTLAVSAPTREAVLSRTMDEGAGVVVGGKAEIVERPELFGGAPNKALRVSPIAVGQPMIVRLTSRPTNIKTQSLIGFHYKIPAGFNIALRLNVGREDLHLKMVGDAPKSIGEIPGILADDKWHWAQFDLSALDKNIKGDNITAIELVDVTAKNPTAAAIEIDNVLIQPKGTGAIKLQWKGSDLSGIEKYRFAWDQNPATAPTEETTDVSREVTATTGLWWAHIQTADKAGNWSAVTHFPVIVP